MSMSKKDYQAIARAIHEARIAPVEPVTAGIVRRITDMLAADNPRFDAARFREACETGRTKGMPR